MSLLGVVRRRDCVCGDRWARKALRQLIVRGMPLKAMHLRPTSRMSSAAAIEVEASSSSEGSFEVEASE